jgi:hypothetical protein
MKLHQLSLFLENRPGQLKVPCKILADAGINIVTLSLADTQQFGILRLIVKDWEKAREVLGKAGCVVNVTEVLAIDVEDRPGGLAALLETLDQAGLAIEYMYAFTCGPRHNKATMVFRFENPDAAITALTAAGINPVGSVELFDRLAQ